MDIFLISERLMGMDAESWARHANPWSAWSRIAGAVPVFLAIWSVHWIGWWAAIPIAAVAIWTYVNPRLFPPPTHADGWAQQGVLGERVWLARHSVSVPLHHLRLGYITTSIAAGFAVVFLYALWRGDLVLGATAWAASVMAKLWFVDRMVWLWRDMKDTHPVYRAWARADWSARAPGAD